MKKRNGCIISIAVVLLLFGAYKVNNAYRNRPTKLFERWVGYEPDDSIRNLEGKYKFHHTESVCFLRFEADQSIVKSIVERNEMSLIEPDPHWSTHSDSRELKVEKRGFSSNLFELSSWFDDGIPDDLVLYWKSHDGDNESTTSGWRMYYSPSSELVYWTNLF